MLDRSARLVDELVVYPDRMRANLDRSGGLFFSEAVLLALVDKGQPRQSAYVMVQRNAMKAIEGSGTFRENLEQDPDVVGLLGKDTIATCFDLEHALRHVDTIIDRSLGKRI
jgi:adenylosuccinate lyase